MRTGHAAVSVSLPFAAGLVERMTNPFTFIQQVRQEVAKVVWPTWKETWITSVMVFIMVVLAATFFLLADQFLGYIVNLILQIGR